MVKDHEDVIHVYIHYKKDFGPVMQQIVFKGLAGPGLVSKGLVLRFALLWPGLGWSSSKAKHQQ